MVYRAFLGEKEINEFSLNGQSIDEIRAGKEIFWQRSKIRVRENVAKFCAFHKCTTINGVDALEVSYEKDIYSDYGTYLELFVDNDANMKRLFEIKEEERWNAVSNGEYFYVVKNKSAETFDLGAVPTAFYKFNEKGELIYSYYNADPVPTDILDKKFQLWRIEYRGFYVIDNIFYILFKIERSDTRPEKMANWFYLVAYSSGACILQKVLDVDATYDDDPSYIEKSTDQFTLNGLNMLPGGVSYNTYHYCNPLLPVSSSGFSVPDSLHYTYLGTDGKNIYLADTLGHNGGNRSKLFLFDGTDYKCVFDFEKNKIPGYLIAIARIEDKLYVALNYGDYSFPDHAYVAELNAETFEKAKIIYKLNITKRKYAWIAIRQLSSKNGKLYVHKEWQVSWTDSDQQSNLGIDELTFPKKKGDTK